MDLTWRDGFAITVRIDNGTVVISSNKEGLLSLADHLTAMAEKNQKDHIHYDEYNSLEEGSSGLIIEMIP